MADLLPIDGGYAKRCTGCGQILPTAAFYRNKARRSGLGLVCKTCANRKTTAWTNEKRASEPLIYTSKYLFQGARARAREAGTPFDLTIPWVQERVEGACELTGLPFMLALGRSERAGGRGLPALFSPTVDQISAGQGYTKANCRVVLWGVNRLMGREGLAAMWPIIEALAQRGPPGA